MLKSINKRKGVLEKEFLQCGMAIRSLRLREKELRRNAKEDILKYRSWRNYELFQLYRCQIIAKLLLLREEITYQDLKSLIISKYLQVSIFDL